METFLIISGIVFWLIISIFIGIHIYSKIDTYFWYKKSLKKR